MTERPSFSAATSTVPLGSVQIEAGYQFTDAGASVEEHTAPFGLVRVPLRASELGLYALVLRSSRTESRAFVSFLANYAVTHLVVVSKSGKRLFCRLV